MYTEKCIEKDIVMKEITMKVKMKAVNKMQFPQMVIFFLLIFKQSKLA